jgi:hypothetical protein
MSSELPPPPLVAGNPRRCPFRLLNLHHRIQIRRSRSDLHHRSKPSVPVNPSLFSKWPLYFYEIKKQSMLVQKYLQNSPFFILF